MLLVGTELGRLVLLFSPEEGRPIHGWHPPDAFRAIKERYSFEYSPNLQQPWDVVQKDGLRFRLGKFAFGERSAAISELAIFNDGIVISALTTEAADAFSQDLIDWAKKTLGYRDFIKPPRQLYLSQIVVQFAHSPNTILGNFAKFSAMLSGVYEKRYKHKVPFEAVSFNLGYDKLNVPQWFTPANFFIERRSGKQFEENTFLCEAGLTTTDHIQALEALEKSLSK